MMPSLLRAEYVSIHALLHQQGEPIIRWTHFLFAAVSIHALLHQQGEHTAMAKEYEARVVSIHALLHQQGEPLSLSVTMTCLLPFQSTPCFISRANFRTK